MYLNLEEANKKIEELEAENAILKQLLRANSPVSATATEKEVDIQEINQKIVEIWDKMNKEQKL